MYSKKEIVMVTLDDLKPHPKNPKLHDDALIDTSIGELGYVDNIVVDEDGMILSGHGRTESLKRKGEKQAEAIQISGWTEEEKEKYMLYSNQVGFIGGFDFAKLEEFDFVEKYKELQFEKLQPLDGKKLDLGEFTNDFEISQGDEKEGVLVVMEMSRTTYLHHKEDIEAFMVGKPDITFKIKG